MDISFLGKLPHIMSYFQICSISFFGDVFTPCLVYIPAGGVFCLLVLFPCLQWLQQFASSLDFNVIILYSGPTNGQRSCSSSVSSAMALRTGSSPTFDGSLRACERGKQSYFVWASGMDFGSSPTFGSNLILPPASRVSSYKCIMC